jgi:hypothetical protein
MIVEPGDLERIAALAERVLPQAPFPNVRIAASTARESTLRTHLAAFGIGGPPRLEARPASTDAALGEAVLSLARGRPLPSVVYVASPMPDDDRMRQLWPRLGQVRRQRTRLLWLYPAELAGLEGATHLQAQVVRTAALLRVESERLHGEERLRRAGIRPIACSAPDGAGVVLSSPSAPRRVRSTVA